MICVGMGCWEGDGEGDGERVGDGLGIGLGEGVGEAVGIGEGEGVEVGVGVGEKVGDGEGEGLGDGDGVGLGLGEGLGEGGRSDLRTKMFICCSLVVACMPALSKASLALGSQIPKASVDTPVLSVLSGFKVCVSEYPMVCAAGTRMYLLAQ
jgi:hypothetical protein